MKKTIKILSLFVLTSIFIISCDNKKNDKESKKEEKKDSKIDKDTKMAANEICKMATLWNNYNDAMRDNSDDIEKYEEEIEKQEKVLKEVKNMLLENYSRETKDYEKAKNYF